MVLRVAAGIHLVLEPQQAQVPALVRAEAGDLDVVAQHVGVEGNLVVLAGEELLLVVEARPPSEVRADLQVFAQDVPHHVRRMDALGRVGVMRAAGGVDVMVAGDVAELHRVNPPLDLEVEALRGLRHADLARLLHRLRAAVELKRVIAFGQTNRLAVHAIDLRMKREVGREALGLRGMHTALRVADDEAGGRGLAVLVLHAERDFRRRQAGEEQIHFVAEADVLRPLADVEGELRLPFPSIAAVELHEAILDREAAEIGPERLLVEHLQVEPEVLDLQRRRVALLAAELVGRRRRRADVVDGLRVRADGGERRGGAGFVGDLHEELPPAVLRQLGLGVARRDLHTHLGVDVDAEEGVAVEGFLELGDGGLVVGRLHRGVERRLVRRAERRAEIVRGLDEPPDLRDERLPLDVADDGQRGGGEVEGEGEKQREGKQGRTHRWNGAKVDARKVAVGLG